MIDTIRVRISKEINPDVNQGWILNSTECKSFFKKRYYYSLKCPDNKNISITYYPIQGTYSKPCLLIEFSVPKLLNGTNVVPICSISELTNTVDIVNDLLINVPCLPLIDIAEGIICRLDIFHDFFVGNNMQAYLYHLLTIQYPRRKPLPYSKHGYKFSSKMCTTTIYDKGLESKDSRAKGMMRIEIKLNETERIINKSGIKLPTLTNMNLDWILSEIEKELRTLGYSSRIVCSQLELRDICLSSFPNIQGANILTYCMLRQDHTIEQLCEYHQYKKSTINKYERLLKEKGISYCKLSNKKKYLPELKVTQK